ncbi:hypothetical protein LCGC14_2677230, partial [marine sediment metagenome]
SAVGTDSPVVNVNRALKASRTVPVTPPPPARMASDIPCAVNNWSSVGDPAIAVSISLTVVPDASSNSWIVTFPELFMNNLVWITGSGTILLAISLLIIYLGGWETLRPQYSISILHEIIIFDGFQFFALFFAFNTLIGSMVAVFGSNSLKWFLVLPVYFIATLSLFFFIFPAVISAIFNKNLPSDSRSEWNKRLNYNLYGLFMIPYGLINLLIGLEALFKMNLIGLFFIMIAISTITPFLFLIFDRFTNIKKLEQEYFEQFL